MYKKFQGTSVGLARVERLVDLLRVTTILPAADSNNGNTLSFFMHMLPKTIIAILTLLSAERVSSVVQFVCSEAYTVRAAYVCILTHNVSVRVQLTSATYKVN